MAVKVKLYKFAFCFFLLILVYFFVGSKKSLVLEERSCPEEKVSKSSSDLDNDERLRIEKWRLIEKMLKKEVIDLNNEYQNVTTEIFQQKSKRLPSIIGIGVEKCGTHALAQFIWDHPLVKCFKNIEAHFFEGGKDKDLNKYLEMMPEVEENVMIMEKTPAYFSFPPSNIPQLIKNSVPEAKLLLILCDPAKRVISDYFQELIMKSISKNTFPTVEDYITKYQKIYEIFGKWENEEQMKVYRESLIKAHRYKYSSTILTTGYYALHLSRWLEYYNSSNLMVINGDKMIKSPGEIIENVQDFLGLPKLILKRDFVRDPNTNFFCLKHPISKTLSCLGDGKMRTRNGRTPISNETLQNLKQFYQHSNEQLYKMLGTDFGW